MSYGVSVVICTYNGARRLPETLKHLALQQVRPDLPWEVIVIDNNSSDESLSTALSEWAKYQLPTPLLPLKEPRPGVSYAREKGLQASSYDYVIQCDDDNWLAPDYITKAANILDADKNIGIVGGWSTGNFETNPPAWFTHFATAYAIGKRRQHSTYINWLATAGVCIRKEALRKLAALNFEHILSGRRGKNLVAGDDLELCAALRAIGYDIFYSVDLSFIHYMPANRLTWTYLKKMVAGQASAQSVFDMYCIVDEMVKHKIPVTFNTVYKKLRQQVASPLKKRSSSLKKKAKFILSLLADKEGDPYTFGNRQYANYYLYLILHKKELKTRLTHIDAFYKKIETLNEG